MQLVKKQDIKEKNVAKAQPLVEAAYNFSIWEKRVYTILASLVDKHDPDFKSYRINIKDIIDFYECKSNDAYERIKEVPESLLSKNKIIKIPYTTEEGYKRILKTHLITAVTEAADGDNSKGNGYIELEFHPRLKPFLLGLKRYLCYDIKNTIGISSVHSLRIFEFLKLHQYKKKHKITVQELKVMLGVVDKHKKYGHFKRIITKAQKDLAKNTDVRFEFEEIKQGRSVHGLNFLIYDNVKNKGSNKQAKEIPVGEEGNEYKLFLIVKDWGITRDTFSEFSQKYPTEHIAECIAYIQQLPSNKPIKNKAGYLRKILAQPTLFNEKKVKKIQKVKETKVKQNTRLIKEQITILKKKLNVLENEIIEHFLNQNSLIKEVIIEHTKKSSLAKSVYNNEWSPTDNLEKNSRFRLFTYAEAKKRYPELLEKIKREYQTQIQQLEQQL